MTIHSDNPFLDPTPDQARRLRGRLGGAVTLWTSGSGSNRAGLTVSSLMVATGEPASVLGLLDPDSDLAAALSDATRPHRVRVRVRSPGPGEPSYNSCNGDIAVSRRCSPGRRLRREECSPRPSSSRLQWGPRLADATTWLGVSVADAREVGWSSLVTGTIDHLEIGDEDDPLVHRRGRYEHPAG